MGRRVARTRRSAPLVVSLGGALALIAGTVVGSMPLLSLAGALLTIVGAMLNATPQIGSD
jgi:hypothetical protein